MNSPLHCFLQELISEKTEQHLTAEVVLVVDNASQVVKMRKKATAGMKKDAMLKTTLPTSATTSRHPCGVPERQHVDETKSAQHTHARNTVRKFGQLQ